MQSFDLENFKTINTIIERDSKDTTYKYALLRGAVEISQEYQHLKRESGDRIEFPLGLLIEKWLLYYYPFIESEIPQKAGEDKEAAKQLSFRKTFRKITGFYAEQGQFSEFYKDYSRGSIPSAVVPEFRLLIREIRSTITNYPMKYLGRSVAKNYYSVFSFDHDFVMPPGKFPVERNYLIHNMGTYSISRDFDTIFEILGSFISGEDAVLFQWAEFTRSASNGNISLAEALEKLRTYPITERDVVPSRTFYEKLLKEHTVIECVWSGKPVKRDSLHIDHVIPFSVLRNNDLWNLLPATNHVNKDKRDKIPLPECIEQRKSAIKRYWNLLQKEHSRKFERELSISLTGPIDPASDWQEIAIQKLIEKCRYYIEVRGFDTWSM